MTPCCCACGGMGPATPVPPVNPFREAAFAHEPNGADEQAADVVRSAEWQATVRSLAIPQCCRRLRPMAGSVPSSRMHMNGHAREHPGRACGASRRAQRF